METQCFVCDDTFLVSGVPCPRCRKQERYDHLAARRAAEAKRRAAIDPRRWLAQVEEHSKADPDSRAYLLAIILATRADRWGRVSVPLAALARICRCSERTILRTVACLVAIKELSVIQHGGGKDRHAVYQLRKLA